MIRDIKTMAWKEWIEIKKSIRKILLTTAIPTIILCLFALEEGKTSLIPVDFMIIAFPFMMGFAALILISDTIYEEKQNKTLEILLSGQIDPISIILGKALPGTIIGSIFSYTILIIVYSILNIQNSILINHFAIEFIVLIPLLIYFMICISIMILILINDQKVGPAISMLLSLCLVFLLLYIAIFFNITENIISFFIFLVFLLLLNYLVTKISSVILFKIK